MTLLGLLSEVTVCCQRGELHHVVKYNFSAPHLTQKRKPHLREGWEWNGFLMHQTEIEFPLASALGLAFPEFQINSEQRTYFSELPN